MRAARTFILAGLLIAGVAGSAAAQRITAPGTYEVNICIAPGFLPQGGAELPAELQGVDEAVYAGTLDVTQNANGTYSVDFRGERSDGARLTASATFDSDWGGFLLGTLPVGSTSTANCLIGIDVANLLSARINGIGSLDGSNQRVQIRLGAGGVFESVAVRKAPGPFRR